MWDAAMICAGGLCGHSTYTLPSGYDSYIDLAHIRRMVRGSTIPIGAKPVLLLSSAYSNRISARRKAGGTTGRCRRH